jgi:hypothetical protein
MAGAAWGWHGVGMGFWHGVLAWGWYGVYQLIAYYNSIDWPIGNNLLAID